jgi:type II secretory pathway predicted ATPase ExeA
MLLQHFGFQENPFGASPDPRCLYPSHTHREALASLKHGFHSNRGFTAMIAPPGMGKTTLLFRFLEDIRETARTVFLFDIDSGCEPREFLAYVLRDIGITPGQSSSEMHEQFNTALVREARAGQKFLIVIDEAQNLSDAVLERVRLLTNFETSRGKLLQIVLSGQLQLFDKLMQSSLSQLRQRVSTICRIDPLSADEIVAYIEFKLKQAGYDGEPLFSRDALKLIAGASNGTPRTINNLCFNALSLCLAMRSKQVNGSMAAEVIADLRLTPQSGGAIATTYGVGDEHSNESTSEKQPARLLKHLLLTGTAAALVVLCAAGILWLAGLRTFASHSTDSEQTLDQKSIRAPVTLPVEENAGTSRTTEPDQIPKKFEITVQPDQRLQDISEQYLGAFDLERLHQIQALNPRLKNPDHIEIGQRIWLPRPPHAPATKHTTSPTGERTLP